jgi:hypothetical protein
MTPLWVRQAPSSGPTILVSRRQTLQYYLISYLNILNSAYTVLSDYGSPLDDDVDLIVRSVPVHSVLLRFGDMS